MIILTEPNSIIYLVGKINHMLSLIVHISHIRSDWLILTACQLIKGYLMARGSGIGFIVGIHLYFFV